jgi:hypothetical protein
MALLSTSPTLRDICTTVLGHANSGDGLRACFTAAASYSYRFDSAYIGNKDRMSNFKMYGDPINTIYPLSLSWAYNNTSVQTFNVQCNHSKWKFYSGIDITGWTVEVWDSSNTTKIGNFSTSTLWDSNVTIRVKPNANNNGGSDKYLILYIATYNDYLIADSYCTCYQPYQAIAPTISFAASGLTLSGTSYTITTGSPAVTIWWTPAGMATSPHTNYIDVTKPGPTNIYSGSKGTCRNGGAYTLSFNMTENAVNAGTYLVTISYDNV